jgi:hypothetical protein
MSSWTVLLEECIFMVSLIFSKAGVRICPLYVSEFPVSKKDYGFWFHILFSVHSDIKSHIKKPTNAVHLLVFKFVKLVLVFLSH